MSGVCAGAAAPVACQNPYEVWQVDAGWQQSALTTIVQSRDGYLWLGTYHGLVRFDGVRSKVFDSGNTPGLQNGLITSLYEDDDGVLWIGHETGHLSRLVGGHFETVSLDTNWAGGAVEGIISDEARDLWLLSNNGLLFRLRDGFRAEPPGGASPNRKVALVRSSTGKPWLVANGKVATLEKGRVLPFEAGANFANDFFENVCTARDGGMWMLDGERLRKWRGGRFVAELAGCPRAPGGVTALAEISSGAVLLGTLRGGLFVLGSGAEPIQLTRTNGLSHDWVRALCQDHEGNVWIGTEGGFDGLRVRKVQMLNAPDGWQGCGVLSFAVTADGAAWVGTEGAGLYHYDKEQWHAFGPSNGVINPYVWSVLETRNKELFVGTYGGGLLAARDEERFESHDELSKVTAPVLALYEGRNGVLYLGTTAGLYRYAAGKLTEVVGKERLELPDVRAIAEASDGTLWFGMSGGGLGSIKDGVLKQFRKADGVGSDLVVCLYAEEDGTLWIGTSDNGVTRFKNGKFANISVGQGLPNAIVSHIVDDRLGNLWIGSHAGILRASKADLNHCADGQIKSVHWLSYAKAEGLASQICSGGFQPGACRAADGRIWFPTPKGLAILDPANVTTNAVPPPVKIEEFVVDSKMLEDGAWEDEDGRDAHVSDLKVPPSRSIPSSRSIQPLRIPAGRQRFEFRYTGLSFIAPDKVHFKYKLEGLERDWTDGGAKRFAQYSYLPPGDYRFQVIACNNDGVWNNEGAALAFTVLPFVWQTWWFQLSSLGCGVGAVGAGAFWISRRRIRRRLELSERQSALERERARIARDIHDDLGASLTRITLLSQSVRGEVEGQPDATAEVDQIYDTARQLTRAMDEIVWAVNPKHDTLDSLVTYLGRFAQHFLAAAPIRCRLDVPLHLPAWALTSEMRHNTFLAFKESLNNVVKHAGATEVRISLELQPNAFVLSIVDNGRGFTMGQVRSGIPNELETTRLTSGNGLANMKKRMEEIGGTCEWTTSPGEGTRVKLRVTVKG